MVVCMSIKLCTILYPIKVHLRSPCTGSKAVKTVYTSHVIIGILRIFAVEARLALRAPSVYYAMMIAYSRSQTRHVLPYGL